MDHISSILASVAPCLLSLIAFYMFVEQVKYLKKKNSSLIPGPTLVLPFIGNAVSLVRDPTRFWDTQAAHASSSPLGISANYIAGKFIVFIRAAELSHKVFANVRPNAFHLVGHPFGKKLFGQHNMIYMFGGHHREIGGHLFDFLFAAQDASTSSLLWAVTLLESHPDVLARVRGEVSRIWTPDSDAPISGKQLPEMRYTQAVAKEVLRYRAPATLVPHIAGEDFPLTETYTVPKGTIVFPSVFESSFQGFTEPDRFDPERFLEAREEGHLYRRNFLVFGEGAHQCVGQRYATNHLVLFIAMFVSLIDFKRHTTDGCDHSTYVPTICPKDDCKVYLSRRCTRFPSL